jgi:hypothetical protein
MPHHARAEAVDSFSKRRAVAKDPLPKNTRQRPPEVGAIRVAIESERLDGHPDVISETGSDGRGVSGVGRGNVSLRCGPYSAT